MVIHDVDVENSGLEEDTCSTVEDTQHDELEEDNWW